MINQVGVLIPLVCRDKKRELVAPLLARLLSRGAQKVATAKVEPLSPD